MTAEAGDDRFAVVGESDECGCDRCLCGDEPEPDVATEDEAA